MNAICTIKQVKGYLGKRCNRGVPRAKGWSCGKLGGVRRLYYINACSELVEPNNDWIKCCGKLFTSKYDSVQPWIYEAVDVSPQQAQHLCFSRSRGGVGVWTAANDVTLNNTITNQPRLA